MTDRQRHLTQGNGTADELTNLRARRRRCFVCRGGEAVRQKMYAACAHAARFNGKVERGDNMDEVKTMRCTNGCVEKKRARLQHRMERRVH